MNIQTEENFQAIDKLNPLAEKFSVLRYSDSAISLIPHGFFKDWLDNDLINSDVGSFSIGRCSGIGVGSIVKYDSSHQ